MAPMWFSQSLSIFWKSSSTEFSSSRSGLISGKPAFDKRTSCSHEDELSWAEKSSVTSEVTPSILMGVSLRDPPTARSTSAPRSMKSSSFNRSRVFVSLSALLKRCSLFSMPVTKESFLENGICP